jgi:hypothetical protein
METIGVTDQASATVRLASDVVALARLGAERAALYVEERRRARERRPPPQRAREVRWNATCAAAAVGAVASLPSSVGIGIAASVVEAGVLAEVEGRATARLIAIAAGDGGGEQGLAWVSDAGVAMVRAGARATAKAVAKRAGSSIAQAALKELGLALPRVGLRAALGTAMPVAEAVWSAAWNAIEMHQRLTPAVRAVDEAFALVATPVAVLPRATAATWTHAWGAVPADASLGTAAAA